MSSRSIAPLSGIEQATRASRVKTSPFGFALAAALTLALPAAPGARAEGPAPSGEGIRVPHERYELPNGMSVILAPDHTLPRVEVNIWYRVGSKDEAPGRSGFAHLFEHLMFMGTERVPDYDVVMEAGGGANNATTSEDRTNYFDWGPSEMLETLLWLEADRLENLGRCMTREKLDLQREVVRNERRQSSENTPYGKAELLLSELMYPPGHPYHISVIGTHEDLQAATVKDVQDFFARFYVPNNASLCIVGDFDPGQARAFVARYFGDLPPGPEPRTVSVDPVRLDGPREIVLHDQVQLPRVSFLWHSPGVFRPGDAEMDLLADALGGGRESRLYQRLVVREGVAVDVAAYQASSLLGSILHVEVYANPDADLAQVRAAVEDEVARIREQGPEPAELARTVAGLETRTVSGLQSIHARADALNRYLFQYGDPDGFERDLQRYRRADAGSVAAWARSVLDPQRRLVMTVLPAPEAGAAAPEARVQGPGPKPQPPAFRPPVPEATQRPSGLAVWQLDRPGLPLVEISLLLPGGRLTEGADKAGLASLTAELMTEGAGERDSLAFAEALRELGAELRVSAETRQVTVSLRVLAQHLDAALDLLADAVARPRFEPADFERVRRLAVEGLRQVEDDPNQLARQVAAAAWFGPDHPYGRPADGWPATVEALSRDDVVRYHAGLLRPQGALLVVAGDLRAERAAQVAGRIDGLLGADGTPGGAGAVAQATPVPPSWTGTRVLLVDRPGAPQTVVRWFFPGHAGNDPRRLEFDVLNVLFGGSFTSRLNRNLRETHGYTYGAGSGWARQPDQGLLAANSAVRADVTGASLAEFLKEFDRLASGDVSAEEAGSARSTAVANLVAGFETLGGTVRTWVAARERGESPAELAADAAALPSVGVERLNARAKEALPADGRLLVLVGDAAQVEAQLSGLSLPAPVLVDAQGRPLSADAGAGR